MGVADNVLKNFSISVDGRGYAGNAEEFKPPKVATKRERHRAGGMDGAISLDMGQEDMEASFILTGHFPDVLKEWGVVEGGETAITALGALESYDGSVTQVVINLRGDIVSVEDAPWKPGEKSGETFVMHPKYYKRTHDGEVVYDIDIEGMKRVVGGKDRLEKIRNAIGL
ncbi:phage major tail tube protein [Marinifilum sp. JC120]|nr:phage major tail tube protein [Marinifilum sp. JC120]